MTDHATSRPLALTCGDPAGVGPEIIATWLAAAPENRDGVCAIGPKRWLATLPVPGIAVGPDDYVATPGQPDDTGRAVALAAMRAAADACASGKCRGVVTGPVSKSGLVRVGFKHPGQTEFFADAWGGEPVMAFAGRELRVVLATWHIPLATVPAALDAPTLARAVAAADRLARAHGATAPRLGVCGLNPHAGEDGLLGTEERDTLDPILDTLRPRFPGLSRCLPGDTVFWRHRRGDFDAVIAMYHDQGLAPVKTLEFANAVNITLGLPHLRTSPDHGTAFDIAGRGLADTGSWDHAVALARRLTGDR